MGQYLAIGITTRCAVAKKELEKGKITEGELLTEMSRKLHFKADIFDKTDEPEYLVFKIKPEVIEKELLEFLRTLYPILYNEDKECYEEVLETLEKTKPDEWTKLPDEKSFEAFQDDGYGEYDYMQFDKPFLPKVKVSYGGSIMLSAEGKIGMEEYGRQFSFFKYCIMQTFKQFKLAGAIRVYITG